MPSRPESGLDCLICATFARQRTDNTRFLERSLAPKEAISKPLTSELAQTRQSGPESGPGFQVKRLKTFDVFPFFLGSGHMHATRSFGRTQAFKGAIWKVTGRHFEAEEHSHLSVVSLFSSEGDATRSCGRSRV